MTARNKFKFKYGFVHQYDCWLWHFFGKKAYSHFDFCFCFVFVFCFFQFWDFFDVSEIKMILEHSKFRTGSVPCDHAWGRGLQSGPSSALVRNHCLYQGSSSGGGYNLTRFGSPDAGLNKYTNISCFPWGSSILLEGGGRRENDDATLCIQI